MIGMLPFMAMRLRRETVQIAMRLAVLILCLGVALMMFSIHSHWWGLFAGLALFFVGGEMIHGFSQALIVGVVVGTYSSIYVAVNVLLLMNISKDDLIIPEKEGEEFDVTP